jgi:hypothetical protein
MMDELIEDVVPHLSARSDAAPPKQPGFRGVWLRWHMLARALGGGTAAVTVDAALVLRAAYAWKRLERWNAEHAPAVLASLQPPANKQAWDDFVKRLGLHAHEEALRPLRVVYAVHNGQDTLADQSTQGGRGIASEPSIFAGIFGGYSAYDHVACTRLFPLQRAVHWTLRLREGSLLGPHHVVIAASFDLRKIFVVNAEDGSVSLLLPRRGGGVDLIPAAPTAGPGGAAYASLRWLETFAEVCPGCPSEVCCCGGRAS